MEYWLFFSYAFHESFRDILRVVWVANKFLDKEKPNIIIYANQGLLKDKAIALVVKTKKIERKTFLLEKYFHVVKRGENVFSLYESHKYALEEKKDSQEVISELFERVEIIATESGVTIRRVKPRSVEDKEKYKEAILDIELEGQFSSLFRFINNLEASPYFIRILSFNLLPQLRSSQQLRCRLSLSKIFF